MRPTSRDPTRRDLDGGRGGRRKESRWWGGGPTTPFMDGSREGVWGVVEGTSRTWGWDAGASGSFGLDGPRDSSPVRVVTFLYK